MEVVVTETRSNDCVVLLSGGIDSAACVAFYMQQKYTVRAIHVTYGQAGAHPELAAATSIAHYYGIPLTVVQLVGAYNKSNGQIFGRNAFLLFTALMELGSSAAMLALGVHSGTTYYDCSLEFISTIQAIFDGQCNGAVRVTAPFLEWTKRDIWEYCRLYQVPLKLTYSCERGLEQPCGKCSSCLDLEVLYAL